MDEAWIVARLEVGIPATELEVHVQPIVDLVTNRDVGGECFLRWIHPVHGFVPPSAWIPRAAETAALGQVATGMVGDWLAAADHVGTVSLNVDPAQLRHEPFRAALAAIPRDRCQGLAIEVHHRHLAEIAESTDLNEQLHAVCDRGIELWVDDLDHTMAPTTRARVPRPTVVKLDRTTLELDDRELAALVRSARPASIVIEGVETPHQRERCRALGIERGQGFLWSVPLRLDDWLARPRAE